MTPRTYDTKYTTEELESILRESIKKCIDTDPGAEFPDRCPLSYMRQDLPFETYFSFGEGYMMEDYADRYQTAVADSKLYSEFNEVSIDMEFMECSPHHTPGLTGFNTTDEGLSFFGFVCGSNYVVPIFKFLYHDGTLVRAYTPTYGNPFDRRRSAPFQLDKHDNGDETLDHMLELFSTTDPAELRIDSRLILADIRRNIRYSDGS